MPTPRPLFSDDGQPPPGSLEIYLPAPASLSRTARLFSYDPSLYRTTEAIYHQSVRRAAAFLTGVALAGPVVRRPQLGLYVQVTARTHITKLTGAEANIYTHLEEVRNPDPGMGWHAHLYIGPHGKDIADGTLRSTRLLDLALAAQQTYLDHRAWLQPATENHLKVKWAVPPGLEQPEITVASVTKELMQSYRRTLCPGEYGPVTRVMADDPYLTAPAPLVDPVPPVAAR